ncbi:hypothetical protein CALCODRAFT_554835 [Calocera cornea HHB12733]|uniref:Uncharacterized protein n=1 Tax=Calocera cornea HHB12733 TaxID=1353952 RepID=A0A165GPP9_9BASI|nr:hypothetical protein CALCODRAFT_554835 [Calocera cornea HHB12733]
MALGPECLLKPSQPSLSSAIFRHPHHSSTLAHRRHHPYSTNKATPMPVWKLHRKRRFHGLPEASPPPEKRSPETKRDVLRPSRCDDQPKPPPVPPGTLYWRRAQRGRTKRVGQLELPPSPDMDYVRKHLVPHRARFIDLEEIFAQFDTPLAREADGAADWFSFQVQIAARNLVADLILWVKRDFESAKHAARMWREDMQHWIDGFEEWELGSPLHLEAVRVAGELPIMVEREDNTGDLYPNDIDPTPHQNFKYGDPDLSDSGSEGLLETPPFTMYSGSD